MFDWEIKILKIRKPAGMVTAQVLCSFSPELRDDSLIVDGTKNGYA